MEANEEMVTRFLNWPLPKSVCPDPCVMDRDYPYRIGTNLLTADEARQMLEYVLHDAGRILERLPLTADGRRVIPGIDFVHHPVFGRVWVDEEGNARHPSSAFACLANEDGTRVKASQCYAVAPEAGRCSCGAIFYTTDAAAEHECPNDDNGASGDTLNAEMLTALKAVVAVADRKTVEFDLARDAIAKAEGCGEKHDA